MVGTATAFAAAGSAVLVADYVDRRLSLSRDIGNIRRLAHVKLGCVIADGGIGNPALTLMA